MTKPNSKKILRYVQHLLSLVLVALIVYIIWYNYDQNRSYEKNKKLNELIITQAVSDQEAIISSVPDAENKLPQILSAYENLYEINGDMVGWISINGTDLSLPVVQGNNNSFYLEHDFYKQADRAGTIFVDCQTNLDDSPINTLLYGHQMKNESMFGILQGYKDNKFYQEHKTIRFDSLFEARNYEVMSVFLTEIYEDGVDKFKYYEFKNIETKQQFDSYITNITDMSLVKTGVTASFGDELITLSTCDDFSNDSRLVVVAKKIE